MSNEVTDVAHYMATERLSAVAGIAPEEVDSREVGVVYDHICGEGFYDPTSEPVIEKYIGPHAFNHYASESDVRTRSERTQIVAQNAEVVLGERSRAMSYGVALPYYITSLLEHKETYNGPSHHKALLLGALSPDTIEDFELALALTHAESSAFVVDIEGNLTARPNQFVFGSGTELPFADNSLDSVHTNYLLHAFQDGEYADLEGYKKLFDEIHRVLRPGGALIMVEGNLEEAFYVRGLRAKGLLSKARNLAPDGLDIADWLRGELEDFDGTIDGAVPAFTDRRDQYEFMHRARNALRGDTNEVVIEQGKVSTDGYLLGISATKRTSLT